ncbi:MAG: ABC transporter permease [Corynebacteriales bacterium]|nr:ABC transporter permease [Mycobacteriales bacterium]
MTTLTVAVTSMRELARRRIALLFIWLLPLVFYVARIDVHWQAIRFLAIGVGWAMATLALFSHVGARRLDQRLAVIGASPTALFFGRQLALIAIGFPVAGGYFLLVAATQDVVRVWAVGLLLATTVLIAAPIGAVVSLVVPRELEGALALLPIMALQLLVDPADTIAKTLPLWSTRELSAYAIELVDADRLWHGLLHFGFVLTLFVLAGWLASIIRLAPAKLPPPQIAADHLRAG